MQIPAIVPDFSWPAFFSSKLGGEAVAVGGAEVDTFGAKIPRASPHRKA